ncbi:hypothetical protein PSYMO_35051, partial [Pseudomonas amygdali pv. mori str. 301020]
ALFLTRFNIGSDQADGVSRYSAMDAASPHTSLAANQSVQTGATYRQRNGEHGQRGTYRTDDDGGG